jgi:GDP-L-fucose synthase
MMHKNSPIYIAGHRGLVGSAILRRLQQDGYTDLITRTHQELDLTNRVAVDAFFTSARPEYVYLAAARVGGILANDVYAADFIRDNLSIQTNVIDAAYRCGTRKLLFLGSSCIYPKMAPQPIKEQHLLTGPLESTNQWYAIAKIAGIKMCQAYRKQYGFNAISLMPTNLYGPGDNFDLESSHVLPALIRKFHLARLASEGNHEAIQKDESLFGPIPEPMRTNLMHSVLKIDKSSIHPVTVELWGTGTARREFLHVDDLASACVFLMEQYDSGEIINVGMGDDLSIKELAEITRDVVGAPGEITFDSTKPDGTPRKLLDSSLITSLGWEPKIGLRQGIQLTYTWYLSTSRGS